MTKISRHETEISNFRNRITDSNWLLIDFDISRRLIDLNQFLQTNPHIEASRHIIVSSIAVLQTIHRSTIKKILDHDSQARLRAAENIKEKISVRDALGWVGNHNVTFGEILAHILPCNSTTDLILTLNRILDTDITLKMKTVVDPDDLRRNKINARPIILEPDALLRDLSEGFRLRHIIAHETASNLTIGPRDAKLILEAVSKWYQFINGLIWEIVYTDLPLTQSEMHHHAILELKKSRTTLSVAIRTFRKHNRHAERSWFYLNHLQWKQATIEFFRRTYFSSPSATLIYIGRASMARAYDSRSEVISGWNTEMEE